MPRALLFAPRVAVLLALRTAVATVAWLEASGTLGLLRRLFWPWAGRLRLLPLGAYRTDVTPVGGARLATDLLFGPGHRAGLTAWAVAGGPRLWGAGGAIHLLGLALPGRPPLPGRTRLGLEASYRREDDVPFRGVGYIRPTQAVPMPLAHYGQVRLRADARLRLRLISRLQLRLAAGFERRRLEDGRRTEAAQPISRVDAYAPYLATLDEDVDAARLDLALGWGAPVGVLVPAPGIRGQARATLWAGRHQALPLLAWRAELEAFVSLFGPWRRLGLRARVAAAHALGHGPVPLPYLPRLGGLETLRGFAHARFQGESVAWAALEYLFALHPRLWMAAFAEVGAAGRENFSGWSAQRLDGAGGGRLMLRVASGYWLLLQVAGSREGAQVWLGVVARKDNEATSSDASWRRGP